MTYSLGWGLSRSDALLTGLLRELDIHAGDAEVVIRLQQHDVAGGFMDIEISHGASFHVIVEAKRGWWLPSQEQLSLYARRLERTATRGPRLRVLTQWGAESAARHEIAKMTLPFRCDVLGWSDIVGFAREARQHEGRAAKWWLDELERYLREVADMRDIDSNSVYVVSLGDPEVALREEFRIDVSAVASPPMPNFTDSLRRRVECESQPTRSVRRFRRSHGRRAGGASRVSRLVWRPTAIEPSRRSRNLRFALGTCRGDRPLTAAVSRRTGITERKPLTARGTQGRRQSDGDLRATISSMTLIARRFTEGSDHVDDVDIRSAEPWVDDRSLLWVDVDSDGDRLAEVDERLGLGGVTRELTGAPDHSIFFRAHAIHLSVLALSEEKGPPKPIRAGLILAPNVVVSVHDEPIRGLGDPVRAVEEDPRFGRLDAGLFAGLLLDGMLHGYHQALEEFERDIDQLDERALRRREPQDDLLEAMVALRHRLAILRRALAPQREVFAALTRSIGSDPSPIGAPDPELVTRLGRTIDAIEHAREHLLGSFDIVMTRTGQRTNDIMRALALISSVLLPPVLVAGVMGMNFNPTFFDEPSFFFVVVALMVALAAVTLGVARWRGWF